MPAFKVEATNIKVVVGLYDGRMVGHSRFLKTYQRIEKYYFGE